MQTAEDETHEQIETQISDVYSFDSPEESLIDDEMNDKSMNESAYKHNLYIQIEDMLKEQDDVMDPKR